MDLPERIENEEELDRRLTEPYPATLAMMRELKGDLIVLGAGGKMGPTLARLARRACNETGTAKRVIAASRFGDAALRNELDEAGIETIACDLLDLDQVRALPRAENVIFMAGRKFGAKGSEALTWMMNMIVPSHVARVFGSSRIVVFSTGCVYPLVAPAGGGCSENDPPDPVGDYAHSCRGRECVFEYYNQTLGVPVLLLRLNYAIDLHYGVLVEIAGDVFAGRPVDLSVGALNCIWQGDANNRALLALNHCSRPAATLNITGAQTLDVATLARRFAREFGVEARFCGRESGKAYLSDASRSIELFGPTRVSEDRLIQWVAHWVRDGGKIWDKPTHFTVTDGQFLD